MSPSLFADYIEDLEDIFSKLQTGGVVKVIKEVNVGKTEISVTEKRWKKKRKGLEVGTL